MLDGGPNSGLIGDMMGFQRALIVVLLFAGVAIAAETKTIGVQVEYRLPTAGPLPRTYRVTLAIVDLKNPDWIISQFACGVVRTVTAENKGLFSETWNGLDDNFMPVPPGEYGLKGIYMPASQWEVDKEWHSITPHFAGGASSWLPSPDEWEKPEPFGGDPVGQPLADVAVGSNGVAVFYYQYLENGLNCPLIDLKKPVGYEQFVRAFPSGGAGGGTSAVTDGQIVWAFSTDGGPKFVYRSDNKPFGKAPGANRPNSYAPRGWVTAMALWNGPTTEKSLVFVAQRGKIVNLKGKSYRESDAEFVDVVTVHNAENGSVLAELPIPRPRGLAVKQNTLYVLSEKGKTMAVSTAEIVNGAVGAWKELFVVPASITPADIEVDSRGRVYLSDTRANHVYQLDTAGKLLRRYGRLDVQQGGTFDRETFMSPHKLATWTDEQGNDRLIVVDDAGPNRATEWSADGRFLREFLSLQTKSNDGYGIDPEHPEHVYLPGHHGWLTRFKVDYATRQWTIDAVWPMEQGPDPLGKLDRAKFVRINGRVYLCGRRSYNVFRLEKDRCVLSAGVITRRPEGAKVPSRYLWHDGNNNRRIDDEELTPVDMPPGVLTYHGQNWLEDLSLVCVNQGGTDAWRLAPEGFDAHGNPIFRKWQKLLTDSVFEARVAGKADAVHGGNELANNFPSDWAGIDGSMNEGFYVQARGGKNFSANEGPQHKISRYVPDGSGGFTMKWRTGRTALGRIAENSEMYGAMRVVKPINGILSVVDQSRCGILLFTEDGLWVDAIFPDGRRFTHKAAGIYNQGGEFFAGHVYANKDNGKIYFAMGKYTPLLYEAEGWSMRDNPVHRLTTLPGSVQINATQIASPPEIALSVRGGAGAARLARFAPALGDVATDGSLAGWESCEPIKFQSSAEQSVEVRCLYDPEHIRLRWHARLNEKFEPRPLPAIERIFTHEQGAHTLSFYIQGDVNAKPGGPRNGRLGDVRFSFGLFKKGDAVSPVAVGLYPTWPGKNATPQTYRTPVGQTVFEHVGQIEGAQLHHAVDADGRGFVLVASLPRGAIPALPSPISSSLRTLVNFEATFGGRNKFWWANSDGSASRETLDEPTEAALYPGSWAPAQFQGIEGGVTVRNWLICGPFGGPGAEQFSPDPRGPLKNSNKDAKQAVKEFCDAAKYPPDDGVVADAVYRGEMIRGYWNDPREVRWKPATVADLDTRIILGASGQVWYGATWIHVPAETTLDATFYAHSQTQLRWFLNGSQVAGLKYQPLKSDERRPFATSRITFKAGWNEIRFRGYCMGYPPFRAGLVLDGSPEALWKLTFAARPPAK